MQKSNINSDEPYFDGQTRYCRSEQTNHHKKKKKCFDHSKPYVLSFIID